MFRIISVLLAVASIGFCGMAWARGGDDDGGHDHGGGGHGVHHFMNHCAPCHGQDGISTASHIPNLRGQKLEYIVQQLKDFRDGRRPGTVMPSMAARLGDSEIQEIAAFLSPLSCAK